MNKQLIEKLLLWLMDDKDMIDTNSEKVQSNIKNPEYSIGDYVIVRSYYSGVIYWKYMGRTEQGILMHEARRLRYRQSNKWISLSELSIHGVKKDSKITEPVNIEIIDPTVCEILKCSEECIESIAITPDYLS